MNVTIERSIHIHASAADVYDFLLPPMAFVGIFVGYGPIPGLARAEMLGDSAPKVGGARRMFNLDGSVVDEEFLALDPGKLHAYGITGKVPKPFGIFVRGTRAEIQLTPGGAGCRVKWRYEFVPTHWLAKPVVMVLGIFFGKALDRALSNLAQKFVNSPH